MRARFGKWLAVIWLIVSGTLCASALLHIPMWLTGMYDPVRDDFLPPDQVPWYVVRIFGFPLLFLATYRPAMRFANSRKGKRGEEKGDGRDGSLF